MQPRTIVGQWLAATVADDDAAERARLGRALNGGLAGMNEDEPAVVRAFCSTVLIRAASLVGRDGVTAMAHEFAQRAIDGASFSEDVARREILASLGEGPHPPLSAGQAFQLRSLLAAFALLKLRADRGLVGELIALAETEALASGYAPPLG